MYWSSFRNAIPLLSLFAISHVAFNFIVIIHVSFILYSHRWYDLADTHNNGPVMSHKSDVMSTEIKYTNKCGNYNYIGTKTCTRKMKHI